MNTRMSTARRAAATALAATVALTLAATAAASPTPRPTEAERTGAEPTASPAVGASAPTGGTAGPRAVPMARDGRQVLALQRVVGQPSAPLGELVSGAVAVGPRIAVLGVTWRRGSGTPEAVQWRTTDRGASSPGAWHDLELDDHGPDPGSEEARKALPAGTGPLVLVDAASVEVRLLEPKGSAVSEAAVELIDPGAAPASAQRVTSSAAGGSATSAVVSAEAPPRGFAVQPTILRRAVWGADETLMPAPPQYGSLKGAVVHHTASSNSYLSTDVPAILRGIQRYHVLTQGWNDIGYQFLIDKWGRIWEGRAGGIDKPVTGAHAPGANTWSVGISLIGDYRSTEPATAAVTAYQRLIAWKARVHQFRPSGLANFGGVRSNAISPHRVWYSTTCPGDRLYLRLPTIRSGAAALVAGLPALTLPRDMDNALDNDVLYTDDTGVLGYAFTEGDGALRSPKPIEGSAWRGVDLTTVVGDWNGDGAVDLVARMPSTGELRLYAGTGYPSVRAAVAIGTGWNAIDRLVGIGDLTADGRPDLLATMAGTGELRVYPGTGTGGFQRPRTIGSGWGAVRLMSAVGDWNGDGYVDLLAVLTNGSARVYLGTNLGTLPRTVTLPDDWSTVTMVAGLGDSDGDGRVDVLVRDGTGHLRIGASTAVPSAIRWIEQTPEVDLEWADKSFFGG